MISVLSYLKDLITSLLQSFGLYQKNGTILLLGLDNAGKTTFLHKLKTNSIYNFAPTERPHVESFQMQGIKFAGWDLGGHEAVRHLWEDYVCEASAVFYLLDASDQQRFEENAIELDALIGEGVLEGIPLAILLNKCDLENAQPSQNIAEAIEYGEIVEKHGEDKVCMFRMSVVRGQGYQEAFQWISSFL